MSDQEHWQSTLVNTLIEISRPDSIDRATLAHLRRSLGETPDRVLAKAGWLFNRIPDYAVDDAILLAGLFALTKGDCPQRAGINFGKAFGSLSGKNDNPSIEKRFIDLLDTDETDLAPKLRQAIALIKAESIGLDWIMLLNDLRQWNHADRYVQRQWARGFWSSSDDESETVSESQTIPN